MVRLKSKRSIKWAAVEFQPNLLKPVKPVRLGVILLEVTAASKNVALIGRVPSLDFRPSEFERVDEVTFHLAAHWLDNMFKDILEGKGKDPFDLLAHRWRWNLYVIEPKILRRGDVQGTLETIAKKRYESFVGKPFEPPEPPPVPNDLAVRGLA